MVQTIEGLGWIISAIGVPFGWWILNSHNALKKELDDHKLYCANNYQSKKELGEFKKEMREMLNEFKNDMHNQLDRIEKSVNK